MAEFCMPSLGSDMAAGTLVAWRKKPGEVLHRGDIIAEVETEKGVIEVEVYAPGVLDRYLVEPGEKVPVGTPLAMMRASDEPAVAAHAPAPIEVPKAALSPTAVAAETPAVGVAPLNLPAPPALTVPRSQSAAPPSVRRRARELGVDLHLVATDHVPTRADVEHAATLVRAGSRLRISPAARRRAEQLGIDARQLSGSGPDGVITLSDVNRAAPSADTSVRPRAAASDTPTRTASRSTETQPAKNPQAAMRRAIAVAMARSKREIPHYYLSTTVDFGPASAWLAEHNRTHGMQQRILPAALLLKAVALAARKMPDFNAYFEDGAARTLPNVHLGVAIALRGGGLVAPALHDADKLELVALMTGLSDLVTRARAGTLRSSELSDATITVTNLGERGVESVLPIIYAPQTAIIGCGKIVERPWVVDGALAIRPIVQIGLAADHRVTDGHLGARFLALIDQLLQEPANL